MCVCVCACVYACMLMCMLNQSCSTLCDPVDCSPPGSSVHGVFQARMLEWVVISSSRGSSPPMNQNHISCMVDRFFTTVPPGKPMRVCVCDRPLYIHIYKQQGPTV